MCLIVKESDKGKVQRALNAMKMDGVREVVGLQELERTIRSSKSGDSSGTVRGAHRVKIGRQYVRWRSTGVEFGRQTFMRHTCLSIPTQYSTPAPPMIV